MTITILDQNVSEVKNVLESHDLETRKMYAVFACSTPTESTRRTYDYTFYLPLTVLAWERIGFSSIILMIGNRSEWESNQLLSWVLANLENRQATTVFLDAMPEHRTTLSQVARLFVANMKEFPGMAKSYVMTTDADLWPLRQNHFIPKQGKNIVLVHSMCCGYFRFNGTEYRMYPMSNIGATAEVWREIMNERQIIAEDSRSILEYLENYFGKLARFPASVASENWYMDQQLISIRIQNWILKHGNETVFKVSDENYFRIDRSTWEKQISLLERDQSTFEHMFDAHLPKEPFYPRTWESCRRLFWLMFGKNSWQVEWSTQYADTFYEILSQ